MGKKLAEIDQQVRELIGDFQRTNFDKPAVTEAINFAQDLIQRAKGFKYGTRLYELGSFPTGKLPVDMLVAKYVYLVVPQQVPPQFVDGNFVPDIDSDDSGDQVIRVLDESEMRYEDTINERWREARSKFKPRRWVPLGNMDFVVVPPLGPLDGSAANYYVRVAYIKQSTKMVSDLDTVDPSIPDYFHDAIRYGAVAYLMEKDTDLKSQQFKKEMMASFMFHLEGGVPKLAVSEIDD